MEEEEDDDDDDDDDDDAADGADLIPGDDESAFSESSFCIVPASEVSGDEGLVDVGACDSPPTEFKSSITSSGIQTERNLSCNSVLLS